MKTTNRFSLFIAWVVLFEHSATAFTWSSLELPLLKQGLPSVERHLAFGDYAEVPESCPAVTTCPVVCVNNVSSCPSKCTEGLTLCADGSCSDDCDDSVEIPCLCDDLPVACPKVISSFDSCLTEYEPFYTADLACQVAAEEALPQVNFKGPVFVFCYVFISLVTLLVYFWCLYNQVLSPVEGSTLTLESHEGTNENWTQTGYRIEIFGTIIHILVRVIFVGVQFLLLLLTIFYYMQQEAITIWAPVFQDEVQVLLAFEIVWMVGFFWCFAFKYPCSIRSLFYRRCRLSEATHIAVVTPAKEVKVQDSVPTKADRIFSTLERPFDATMRFIFSYPYGRNGESITFCEIDNNSLTGTKSFYHRWRRYVFNAEQQKYIPGGMDIGKTFGDFLSLSAGLSSERAKELAGLVGPNILPMTKPTLFGAIWTEFDKPFYLYQNFMVWTWAPYWYYYMFLVQTTVRFTAGVVVAVVNYVGDSQLYKISNVEGNVDVLRDNEFVTIDVKDVVPGDVIGLSCGYVHCDVVVIQGDHILVDESALTGEADPSAKYELDKTNKDSVFDPKRHGVHSVSAGTTIMEVGSDIHLGLVTKTGSFTAKGELLSDVLSYSRHKFKFDDEVKVVILILIVQAIILFALAAFFLQDQLVYSWFYGMFIVGTVIPPLLPTVFVVSVGISAKRLQGKRITCTYPEGILVAGKVQHAFFDKTGTLTKQGMDFIGTSSRHEGDYLDIGMAVCHTLKTSSTGEMVGNQVDKSIFRSSGALIDTSDQKRRISHNGVKYAIRKTFEFDSHRQTQSVIIEHDDKKYAFVKGSAEAIRPLCTKESIPSGFDEAIRAGSKSGFYQIAIAFRDFSDADEISNVSREDTESGLTFAGFVNFRNVMRDVVPSVTRELLCGDVSCRIVTGDSVFTGIYIAREAGIIAKDRRVIAGSLDSEDNIQWIDADSDKRTNTPSVEKEDSEFDLALTGAAWKHLREADPKYAFLVAKKVKVFGRCKPSDKVSVITSFVEVGGKTLMVGDGQNDCGALKMAHVGIALSSAEASIVAPFTSLDKCPSAATEVLREGRCALASALATYKYYLTYGQVESYLQLINAYFAISFTEWCWVFLDGIWSTTMAFSLPLAKAAAKLSPIRPTASLLGPHTMTSIGGILSLNFLFICIGLLVLFGEPWFACRMWGSNDVSNVLTIGDNYESTVLFAIGGYQYIASAMALNFGYMFREHYLKNYVFVFLSTLWTVFQLIMVVYPSDFSCIWRVNCSNEDAVRWVTSSEPVPINNPFNTTVMPVEFRWKLFTILVCNLLALMGWEYFVVNGPLRKKAKAKKIEIESALDSILENNKEMSGSNESEEIVGQGVTSLSKVI